MLYTIIKELSLILKENNECSKIKENKNWWEKRKELNERLKNLLLYMEHILFDKWKGIHIH
jgi:hypothetical protein